MPVETRIQGRRGLPSLKEEPPRFAPFRERNLFSGRKEIWRVKRGNANCEHVGLTFNNMGTCTKNF